MASRKLSAQRLQEIHDFAAQWGKIITRRVNLRRQARRAATPPGSTRWLAICDRKMLQLLPDALERAQPRTTQLLRFYP
jgi:hypothetical protein